MAGGARFVSKQLDTESAMVMVAQPPQPKIKDRRTGEIAVDTETGAQMMTVDVLFASNGEAEVLTVAVPEPGITGELVMETPFALTGLIARRRTPVSRASCG